MPVAVEVSTALAAKDEFSELFRKVADEGHYGGLPGRGRTRQGTYVVTPSGRLLASGNAQDADATVALLNRALEAYRAMPGGDRLPARPRPAGAAAAPPSRFPEGGLALDVSLRKFFPRPLKDRPVDPAVVAASGLPERLRRFARQKPETYWEVEFNQDHAWLTADEARRLVPVSPQVGEKVAVDPDLVARLARLHMLDTVRALADSYPAGAVQRATLRSEVIGRNGHLVTIRLTGEVALKQTGLLPFARTSDETSPVPKKPERSYQARLEGRAEYDTQAGRFTAFELVALGPKTGSSKLSPFDKTTLGVAFTLANPTDTGPIEPRYLSQYGWK